MKRTKLAIFDMDGTLFDTSEVNYRAYAEAAESLGYKIERKKFLEVFVGKNYREFLPLFGIIKDEELAEIHQRKKETYINYLQYAKMNEQLFHVINCIRSEYVIILATTASRKNTEEILQCFGVSHLFDSIITQEDTKKLKPNPECYLKAMEIAQIGSDNTIIFEDSDVGVTAGLASGAVVYRVNGF